jgi:hypothetical protein
VTRHLLAPPIVGSQIEPATAFDRAVAIDRPWRKAHLRLFHVRRIEALQRRHKQRSDLADSQCGGPTER